MSDLIVLETEIQKRRDAAIQKTEPENLYRQIVEVALAAATADPIDYEGKTLAQLTPEQRRVCDTLLTEDGGVRYVFPSLKVRQKSAELVLRAIATATQAGFLDELLKRTKKTETTAPNITIEFTNNQSPNIAG